MLGLVQDLLARQDPDKKHSLLTRVIVCAIVLASFVILYGFYGLIAAVAVYLIGVDLMDLPFSWVLIPLAFSVLIGVWKAAAGMRDYLANYGHGPG